MARELHQLFHHNVRLFGGVVGMRADRAEHIVMGLDDGFQVIEAAYSRRDGHHEADARRASAVEHRIEVGVELGKIEMAWLSINIAGDERPIFFKLLG
jgi:hypothetical protein